MSINDTAQSLPAKASDYLYWLKKYHCKHPKMLAILYLRVSGRSQNRNGNLKNQERVLQRKLKKLSVPVIDCFYEVKSGWITGHKRGILRQAICKAQQYPNAVIVATSTDRFLRNRNFTTDKPDLMPTVEEFETLKKIAGDIPLLTVLYPDLPADEVRSEQSKWGQMVKDNKGGRPLRHKKQRRLQKLPEAIRLYEEDKRISEIARQIKIARSTVDDWIKKI
jgi:DNA invertase Pin-like site-specific DNA recombinase